MKSSLKARRPIAPPSAIPVSDNWAYVEWHGVYAAGRLGAWIRRRIELKGFRALLPRQKATQAWRAHFDREESCDLCKKSEKALL